MKAKKTILRYQMSVLKKRLQEAKPLIQVMVGPRQIGKTTMVKQVLTKHKNAIYVSSDMLLSADVTWIIEQWNRAKKVAEKEKSAVVLAIDEIQKIENWSEIIKNLWDLNVDATYPVKLILLGSSRLLIQQGLTESLAGRFELIHITHWRYNEMFEAFGMTPEEYVYYGAYPGAMAFYEDDDRWKSYVRDSLIETTISKDILMLTRVDKPSLLKRLFELGSIYSGQLLSFTKVLGQLQDAGNTVTLSHYLELLESAGMLTGINKFAGDVSRKRSSSPKFQTYNMALVNAYNHLNFEETQNDSKIWGRMVESAVGAYLLTYVPNGLNIYYWKDGNAEIDFLLEYKKKLVAIEVKTSTKTAKHFETLQKNFKIHACYRVGPLNFQSAISWQNFLKMNVLELFD
jgi:predicted AAA+ superfamily ATPase